MRNGYYPLPLIHIPSSPDTAHYGEESLRPLLVEWLFNGIVIFLFSRFIVWLLSLFFFSFSFSFSFFLIRFDYIIRILGSPFFFFFFFLVESGRV
jgi:hypothetical protein